MDFADWDDAAHDRDVTYEFEVIDVKGPGGIIVSTVRRDAFAQEFRKLYARHPVRVVRIDPRRADHPDRLAEEAALRELIFSARRAG